MTVPSTGDISGDTRDIGDTGDASWEKSFSVFVYSSWLHGVATEIKWCWTLFLNVPRSKCVWHSQCGDMCDCCCVEWIPLDGWETRQVGWLLACLTSQQQASVSQGRTCSDNFTCCHTEIQVADPTFYLTQSQYTDTGPTSPSADPITPGAWQGSHWSAIF